jgi:branched-chain amino acid transport system ATP-binding protein
MLEIRDLHVRYGGISALSGVSLTMKAGEIVAILGANGAGKSTCLRAISGLVRAHAGEISVAGKSIRGVAPEQITRSGVAHVPEHRRIFAPLSVADNLLMGAWPLGRRGRRTQLPQKLQFVYELFPRLAERRNQLGGTLSGGEQQMLAIGRALMSAPRVLLLDEPSVGLAPLVVDKIMETIEALRTSGLSILLVEQFARSALRVADRAYVLRAGRVALEGTSADLRRDTRMVESYLGSATSGADIEWRSL